MLYRRLATIACALLAIALPACDDSPQPDASAKSLVADAMAKDQATTDPTVMDVHDESAIDVGDVEQAIRIVGRVSQISASDNIIENAITDGRDRVRIVNVEVNPPNPDTLWIGVRVDCTREFVERPVILDTKILVDGTLMDSFTVVMAANAQKNMFQKDVEVLFGRDDIPETMLVTMESEALLLPEGTDLTTIDPYSINEGQRTKAIAYTPVRIDFTAPGPKPKRETATPPETATPSEAAATDPS